MPEKPFKIHCRFPGGNIIVKNIAGDTVYLEQDLRDSSEWWFYWNFCIEYGGGKTLSFKFTNQEVVGPWGPAVSDDLIAWTWLGAGRERDRAGFTYRFAPAENKKYFAFSLPYQVSHWDAFCLKHRGLRHFNLMTLGRSEQDRPIPLLRLGRTDAPNHMVFTCRHHACESTAAYQLEGVLSRFIQALDTGPLSQCCLHAMPFVDIDGVENGDQGKFRKPFDHNQDYTDRPRYAATTALMEYVKTLKGRLLVGLDFHSPWKWVGRNDHGFFPKPPSPQKQETEKLAARLIRLSGRHRSGNRVMYDGRNDLEPGQEWNNGTDPTACRFFCRQQALLAATFEYPYFGNDRYKVTQENSREFGRVFGQAIEEYIKENAGILE